MAFARVANPSMEVQPGKVYEHFKDGKYLVLAVADDSTNAREGNKVVVYVSLTYGKTLVRDLAEFTEEVEWPDGKKGPRFAAMRE